MTLEDSVEYGVRRCVVSKVLHRMQLVEHSAVKAHVWVVVDDLVDRPVRRIVSGRVDSAIWLDVKLKFISLRYNYTLKFD